MKFRIRLLVFTVSFLLPTGFAGPAFPWGNAPTHFSIGNDLIQAGAPAADVRRFIVAQAAPDIAWTGSFRRLRYIHSLDFAECLYAVAKESARVDWLDLARAWGAHLAADLVAHNEFVPEQPSLHNKVEMTVDAIIFYEGSPLATTPLDWSQVNISPDDLSPELLYLASCCYQESHPEAKLVKPSMVVNALKPLRTVIKRLSNQIKGKGNADSSNKALDALIIKGRLPGDWQPFYLEAVNRAQTWLEAHP